MSKVSTILPISREEAESLLRLIPHLDRLTAEPDGLAFQVAEFRALQAMFHDVLRVLNPGQKQQLLNQWLSEQQVPLWQTDKADLPTPEQLTDDAANHVLTVGVQVLQRSLCRGEDDGN
ncbi:hypothetical protein [Neisseria yangbaofengii]|uniref:hypothetical protein n=1 Tax=Neisseria yangbaofengii TaxID=2709396 RepID=UPI0013EDC84F|nr:hypothetical protein [Neisseria yangbaofengii]